MACCGTSCGSCCGGGCGGGYGGGYGGGAGGAGSGGVLVDTGTTTSWNVRPGGCSLIVPGPRLISCCDPRVSCHCVCASDCCMPCCGSGSYGGGRGANGPGLRVDMCYPGYEVIAPAAFLCSTAHHGRVSTNCCDPCDSCCGPC